MSSGDEQDVETDVPAFRIAVVAELTPREEFRTAEARDPTALSVHRTTFDETLAKLVPPFTIDVDDPFGGAPLPIDLRWQALRDLRPDGLVDTTPLLSALLEAKRVLSDAGSAKRGPAEVRAHLARLLPREGWAAALTDGAAASPAPAAPAVTTPEASSLDALLDKVDLTTPAESPGADPISSLLSAVTKSSRPKGAAPAGATANVDAAFVRVLSSILAHDEVRRLERLWRSVKLLVDHADPRRGVEVFLVSASDAEIDGVLEALGDADSGAFDLVVLGDELRATASSLERGKRAAAAGEAMHAPVFVSGSAELVGGTDLASLGRGSRKLSTQDDARSVAVRAAAADDAMRWLFVALNGVWLRAPYDMAGSRLRGISFQQPTDDERSWVCAWPAFALAALCAKSFAETGFPTPITAPAQGLSGLVVREVSDRGASAAVATEAFVSDSVSRELADAGLVCFTGIANRDAVHVLTARALARSGGAAPKAAEGTLADALFVGSIVRALRELGAAIPPSTPEAKIGAVAEAVLLEMFAGARPHGPEVFAEAKNGVLSLRIVPHRVAGVTLEELSLELPLR